MSSTSTNGSRTPSTGSASSPASSGSRKWPSLKFCANQRAAHDRPRRRPTPGRRARRARPPPRRGPRAARAARRRRPRPARRTRRRSPSRRARRGRGSRRCTPRSAPSRAGAHVARSSQSNGVAPLREPARTAQSARGEPLDDAPAGLAGGAEYQCGVLRLCGHATAVNRAGVRVSIARSRKLMRERLQSSAMDAVAGLLDGPRARGAFLLRSSMDPPWSLRIAGRGAADARRGRARPGVDPARRRQTACCCERGRRRDRARPGPYTVADDPPRAPQIVIEPGQECRPVSGRGCRRDGATSACGRGATPRRRDRAC